MPGMNGMSGMDSASTTTSGSSGIATLLIIWFVLTGLATLYVAWDALTNNPELKVMRVGWVLVTLYTGVIGAALYILACKPPSRAQHDAYITPQWKQALGSTIHCMAGDATGIIVAATITLSLGNAMWVDTISEYIFGFAFGLLIFQALFMRDMFGGSYGAAVRRSLVPEWLSMNTVMAGMIPTMVILMTRNMTAMNPASLEYWGVMSLATLVGLVAAYPTNWWLVAHGLKQGMGTEQALGSGGSSGALAGTSQGAVTRPVQTPRVSPVKG